MIGKYKHIKTGNVYLAIKTNAINCTNAQDNQRMVIYVGITHRDYNIYCREYEEFMEKFEKI